jgi:hypothetical protein
MELFDEKKPREDVMKISALSSLEDISSEQP